MLSDTGSKDYKELSCATFDISSWDSSLGKRLIHVARDANEHLLKRLNCP